MPVPAFWETATVLIKETANLRQWRMTHLVTARLLSCQRDNGFDLCWQSRIGICSQNTLFSRVCHAHAQLASQLHLNTSCKTDRVQRWVDLGPFLVPRNHGLPKKRGIIPDPGKSGKVSAHTSNRDHVCHELWNAVMKTGREHTRV